MTRVGSRQGTTSTGSSSKQTSAPSVPVASLPSVSLGVLQWGWNWIQSALGRRMDQGCAEGTGVLCQLWVRVGPLREGVVTHLPLPWEAERRPTGAGANASS